MTALRQALILLRAVGAYSRGIWRSLLFRLRRAHMDLWSSFATPRTILSPPSIGKGSEVIVGVRPILFTEAP